MVFIMGAKLKCSNEELSLQFNITSFERKGVHFYLNCLKYHLKVLEPTSKLIENFAISEEDIKICSKRIYVAEIEQLQQIFEESVNQKTSVFTCGAVSGANDYVKFIAKNAILQKGNIHKVLREVEMRNIKEYFQNVVISTVDCITKRFEDNPSAFLANNTLNYFFKKSLIPSKAEFYFQESITLAEVENNVDSECIKEKLKLTEFGNTTLLQEEAAIFIASAKSKCNLINFKSILKSIINSVDGRSWDSGCSKYYLHKLEPTSKLANYSNDDSENIEDSCKNYEPLIYLYRTINIKYENAIGKLTETTCGLVTDEFLKAISYKTILLKVEEDEAIKNSGMEELLSSVIEKLHRLADCVLKNVA
ncbi:unnamed protein product [Chironomus riparius]|uniref:DUF5442 domain-containing protein n=1 Tax=Chironomus riparius TaxID=315576 RepID=A0A9N9WTU8_9DIPT|nr:unnamed protein product [Chironomus riparius]